MAYSQYFLIVFLVLNSIVYLIAQQYTAIPRLGEPLRAALKRSFELRCVYNGIGDGEFEEWFRKIGDDEVSVNAEKSGHYVVKENKHESNLTIRIFVASDADVNKWFVRTKGNPSACEFGRISLLPAPQGIVNERGDILDTAHESIRRNEEQSLRLKCLIEPPNISNENQIQWEFSQDNKQPYGDLPDGVTRSGATIQIDSIKKSHRGYYRCKLNNVPFVVLLRVKDRLAALWPFLGIVGIVAILVIIILIFEKRQKSDKKNLSTDDDDQDRASDPLVRTTIKPSDNDNNKKRAVKA